MKTFLSVFAAILLAGGILLTWHHRSLEEKQRVTEASKTASEVINREHVYAQGASRLAKAKGVIDEGTFTRWPTGIDTLTTLTKTIKGKQGSSFALKEVVSFAKDVAKVAREKYPERKVWTVDLEAAIARAEAVE